MKPSRLDTEEQEKIAKSGLEMKMVTNEMDAETDKWNSTMNDENNDIVKRAKNMSAMAFSMYQFTKGEGALRTTQDLFTQAEYFAEEANRLYKVVRQFSYQVGRAKSKFFTFAIKLTTLRPLFSLGSSWATQKGTSRSTGQSSNLCANVAVYSERTNGWQVSNIREGRSRHTRDQKSHEYHIKGRFDVLRLCK